MQRWPPLGQWVAGSTPLQVPSGVVPATGLEETAYQVLLLVAGLLCLGVIGYAWRHRERRVARLTILLLSAVGWWIVTAWLVVQFAGRPIVEPVARSWYVGITISVLGVFLLALQYTGREQYVTRRTVALLFVPVVLTNVGVWAPPTKDAFLAFGAVDPTSFYGYVVTAGPLFYVHTAYSYLLLGAAAVMFVSFALRSEFLYQRQVAAILVAVAAPWVGNALYVFGSMNVDLTPVAFAVAGLALWWAVVREDLLEVIPVARSAVVDNINAAVFVLDRQNTLLDVNPEGRSLLDLDDDDIGEDASALLAGMPAVRDRFEDVADSRAELETEVSFGASHYRVNVSPLEDRSGRVIGRLFLVSDVTRQKRRERELERQNEQLEEFAGVVSHDLRNPLNVAAGNLELLRTHSDGGEEFLADAERAVERMDDIIDDVLTLAREGKSVEETEPVDIELLAANCWENVQTATAALSVVDPLVVHADEGRLQQLLENLFRNSIEHVGEDVSITIGRHADGFYVVDDGPGIDPEHREEIFEAGYTTNPDGTGFGLNIVEEIAAAHGWEVAIADGADGGARFEFTGVRIGA